MYLYVFHRDNTWSSGKVQLFEVFVKIWELESGILTAHSWGCGEIVIILASFKRF